MNPNIELLHAYPFEKLSKLKEDIIPATDKNHISLSIGEPKHQPPSFVKQTLISSIDSIQFYPKTKAEAELRESIQQWLCRRFQLKPETLDAEKHILPLNGTREGLFAFAQAIIDNSKNAIVLIPNPFYQIYEGATLLAGATPYYYSTTEGNDYLLDLEAIPKSTWEDCQLIYICSPGNPTGKVYDSAILSKLIDLSLQYNFIIAADECYSEIYPDEEKPPVGLLETAHSLGNTSYKNCVVFHSLSKRSNLPGLRSGFIAGDATIMAQFLKYRTYHGCAMPLMTQQASIAAWNDEQHVIENRKQYAEKFTAIIDNLSPVIDIKLPDAGFNLWLKTPIDDSLFCQQLYASQNITVLPGQYLSRTIDGNNPGLQYVRIALVASITECLEAAERIKEFLKSL